LTVETTPDAGPRDFRAIPSPSFPGMRGFAGNIGSGRRSRNVAPITIAFRRGNPWSFLAPRVATDPADLGVGVRLTTSPGLELDWQRRFRREYSRRRPGRLLPRTLPQTRHRPSTSGVIRRRGEPPCSPTRSNGPGSLARDIGKIRRAGPLVNGPPAAAAEAIETDCHGRIALVLFPVWPVAF